jgi:hypothetical protein
LGGPQHAGLKSLSHWSGSVPFLRVFPTQTDEVNLGLLDELAGGLAAVQRSLDRLDAGTYGRCDQCGEPLDDDLLEHSPNTTVCECHNTSIPDPTVDDRGTIEP